MIAPRRDPEMLLRRYWDASNAPAISAGLGALSAGYRVALAMRECAYRWRVFSTSRLPCPVISVGNITLGGSGKTPMVEETALCLRELGANPAVVSRGYGRDSRGVALVADRDGPRLGPRAGGDEPVMLADRLPGVPIVVGENRFEAGRVAIDQCGATAIVLDDGFQHRTVQKDLEILVVNGRAPWGNGRLFPRGMLREPLPALGRANLIVLTNPPGAADVVKATETIRRRNARAPVVVAQYQVIGARLAPGVRELSPADLHGRRLLAFAGLGSPRGFADTLIGAGVDLAGLIEYPDHYWFDRGDLTELGQHAASVGAEGLITTEKDWVRIRSLDPLPGLLCVLRVRLSLDAGREQLVQALDRTLASMASRR